MKMQDSREIKASPEIVFEALISPDVLQECIPGAQSVTGNITDGYEAVVTQKVGPVKATFTGHVEMSHVKASEEITIAGSGKGGAAGFAKGGAVVKLEALEPERTRLTYDVEAKVGGKLAHLGSRIIDGFAKRMADQFFQRLQECLENDESPENDVEAEQKDADKKKGWFKRMMAKS